MIPPAFWIFPMALMASIIGNILLSWPDCDGPDGGASDYSDTVTGQK